MAEQGTPAPDVLAALHEVRARGQRVVLATGRVHHDLSRWVDLVLRDPGLAAALLASESTVGADSPSATVDAARVRLVATLQARPRR